MNTGHRSPLPRRIGVLAISAGMLTAALAGCSSNSSGSGSGHTTLVVFAASSLTGTFTTLATDFEATHPNVTVVPDFNSSTTLAEQITSGADADVIATADQASMQIVQQANETAATPTEFATNTLIVAVPPGNPGNVTGLSSLNTVPFVTCITTAPCGAAAAQVLQNGGVTAKPKSYETDDQAVLTEVETGQVEAGMVYVTDGLAAGSDVKAITIPAAQNVVNPYYIAAVKGSKNASLANAWVKLILSSKGQQVLRQAGFAAAP